MKFVLDTTAITDSELREREHFESICESANEILNLIAVASVKLNVECYIPYPSVYNELIGFLKRNNCSEEILIKLDTWLIKKTPNRYEIKIPAIILYEYVISVRQKMNKSRRLAEDFIWESSAVTMSSNDVKAEIGNLISKFRDRYRTTVRQGIIDSPSDLDVLLLAKELNAGVVSSDVGIKSWSERFGLRFIEAAKFPKILREMIRRSEYYEHR